MPTRTVKTSDLIGRLEAADILGVTPPRVNQLLRIHDTFPRPLVKLRAGMIFSRAEVEAWKKEHRG